MAEPPQYGAQFNTFSPIDAINTGANTIIALYKSEIDKVVQQHRKELTRARARYTAFGLVATFVDDQSKKDIRGLRRTLAEALTDAAEASDEGDKALRVSKTRAEELEKEVEASRASMTKVMDAITADAKAQLKREEERKELEEELESERLRANALQHELEGAHSETQAAHAVIDIESDQCDQAIGIEQHRSREAEKELAGVRLGYTVELAAVRSQVEELKQKLESAQFQALENLEQFQSEAQAARDAAELLENEKRHHRELQHKYDASQEQLAIARQDLELCKASGQASLSLAEADAGQKQKRFIDASRNFGVRYQDGALTFSQETIDHIAELMALERGIPKMINDVPAAPKDIEPTTLQTLIATVKLWLTRHGHNNAMLGAGYKNINSMLLAIKKRYPEMRIQIDQEGEYKVDEPSESPQQGLSTMTERDIEMSFPPPVQQPPSLKTETIEFALQPTAAPFSGPQEAQNDTQYQSFPIRPIMAPTPITPIAASSIVNEVQAQAQRSPGWQYPQPYPQAPGWHNGVPAPNYSMHYQYPDNSNTEQTQRGKVYTMHRMQGPPPNWRPTGIRYNAPGASQQ